MAKINKTNVSTGIPSSQDIRTQQASVFSENAQKSEYATRFANQTQTKNTPNKLNQNTSDIAKHVYPSDLGRYYIGFEFQKYTRENLKKAPKSQIDANIALPMPGSGLVDALHQRYEEIQTGILGNALNDYQSGRADLAALKTAGAGAAALLATWLSNRYSILQNTNNLRVIGNIAIQSQGLAFNPFLAVFYVSPSFKVHEFAWRFTPRNAPESMTLREIIRIFHEKMSPSLDYGNIFFTYPDVVIPKLYAGDKEAEYMYEFKPCVIENCIVNYSPNGVPSFFAGTNAPTEIELRLTLKELELWLKSDYAESGEKGKGK